MEISSRPLFSFLLFTALLAFEFLSPQRENSRPFFSKRILANLGMIPFIGVVLLPFIYLHPFLEQNALPLDYLKGVVLLDFFIYIQHRLFHKFDILWRFHKPHHTDSFLDATSAFRFHPIEVATSALYKLLLAWAFGIPLKVLVFFEFLANLSALFQHANIKFPISVNRLLAIFLVTPNHHKVHHSIETLEMNSNFAQIFSFWDRLLGTYKKWPSTKLANSPLGLKGQEGVDLSLGSNLKVPFEKL